MIIIQSAALQPTLRRPSSKSGQTITYRCWPAGRGSIFGRCWKDFLRRAVMTGQETTKRLLTEQGQYGIILKKDWRKRGESSFLQSWSALILIPPNASMLMIRSGCSGPWKFFKARGYPGRNNWQNRHQAPGSTMFSSWA